MTTKCNKRPLNLPIDSKIYQIAIRYTNIFQYKTLQNLPKNGIFGLKRNHLATLLHTSKYILKIRLDLDIVH
jgi:hypothetical protein